MKIPFNASGASNTEVALNIFAAIITAPIWIPLWIKYLISARSKRT